jgi:phage baseplate assembly protein V
MNSFAQTETERRLANIALIGVIETADYSASPATARVRVGELLTGDLAMATTRAGPDRDWHPYEIGEQVVILCPSGEPANGVIIAALNSDAAPNTRGRESVRSVNFADGAQVVYDRDAHHMTVNLAHGSIEIIANGGVNIIGDITLTGKMTASDDVIAAGISLKNHKHQGVQAGGAVSGKPL